MTPDRLLNTAIYPALSDLAGMGIPSSPEAARFMLTIALQESGLKHRRQVVAGGAENGPASSFVQFEQGGGCKGVLTHRAVADKMKAVCEAYNVAPTPSALWEAMRYQDIVAMAAARLLVYTLPSMLPVDDIEGWDQYLRAWRPGRPHPETWPKNWALASAVVGV